jgi:hypothetical protein
MPSSSFKNANLLAVWYSLSEIILINGWVGGTEKTSLGSPAKETCKEAEP